MAHVLEYASDTLWSRFQDLPDAALPEELRDANSRRIWRLVDGTPTQESL